MTFLEQLKKKAYKIDLSSLQKEDKKGIKNSMQEETRNHKPAKLSETSQRQLAAAINEFVSKT